MFHTNKDQRRKHLSFHCCNYFCFCTLYWFCWLDLIMFILLKWTAASRKRVCNSDENTVNNVKTNYMFVPFTWTFSFGRRKIRENKLRRFFIIIIFTAGCLLIGCIDKNPADPCFFPHPVSSDINYHTKRRGIKMIIMCRSWREKASKRWSREGGDGGVGVRYKTEQWKQREGQLNAVYRWQ